MQRQDEPAPWMLGPQITHGSIHDARGVILMKTHPERYAGRKAPLADRLAFHQQPDDRRRIAVGLDGFKRPFAPTFKLPFQEAWRYEDSVSFPCACI